MSSDKAYLDTARKAALEAGKILMASYGKLQQSQIQTKSKNDFVTEIDKLSEKKVIQIIKNKFPTHSILGEESGSTPGENKTTWIIDPLDGTANYIHAFPMFSVSIGVQENGVLRAGVIYDPLHKEMFSARKGEGAFLNGRPIKVSSTAKLEDALMTTGIPFKARDRFDAYISSFSKISMASAGMRRGGSAALDLAYVACGRLDGFWELGLSPWDIAGGAIIIEEAGGVIQDLWGGEGYLKSGDILGTNGRIQEELKDITSRTIPPKKDTR